jgi:hypothetical protein
MTISTNTTLQIIPLAEPSNSWQETATANGKMVEVFRGVEQNRARITQLLISSSFFLPMDVLRDKQFKISPIVCLSVEDFAIFYDIAIDNPSLETHCDCKYELLAFAKFIGISARKNLATGQINLVFKLWYGNKPDLQKGFNHDYETRKHALYNFLSTHGSN